MHYIEEQKYTRNMANKFHSLIKVWGQGLCVLLLSPLAMLYRHFINLRDNKKMKSANWKFSNVQVRSFEMTWRRWRHSREKNSNIEVSKESASDLIPDSLKHFTSSLLKAKKSVDPEVDSATNDKVLVTSQYIMEQSGSCHIISLV